MTDEQMKQINKLLKGRPSNGLTYREYDFLNGNKWINKDKDLSSGQTKTLKDIWRNRGDE